MSPYTERVLLAARAVKAAKTQLAAAMNALATYGPGAERDRAFNEAAEAAHAASVELCDAACAD